jgi:uncharacterized membrane protein
MSLSILGIFHTIIGIGAIIGAFVGFIKYGKINLSVFSGKVYLYATIVTSITALGLSKHGGFNAGHLFSLFIMLLVIVACLLNYRLKSSKIARHYENFLLSLSLFLSFIPAINETFTRIPFGRPLAKDIQDPIIAKTLLIFFILFIVGSIIQYIRQRKVNREISPADSYDTLSR